SHDNGNGRKIDDYAEWMLTDKGRLFYLYLVPIPLSQKISLQFWGVISCPAWPHRLKNLTNILRAPDFNLAFF
ncbi:MAG: hypothetical protein JXX14_20115, partial [Deltaproteobacteria bacterium]|nr:hypothetical protein [Deltaproteobacteria bacterium]